VAVHLEAILNLLKTDPSSREGAQELSDHLAELVRKGKLARDFSGLKRLSRPEGTITANSLLLEFADSEEILDLTYLLALKYYREIGSNLLGGQSLRSLFSANRSTAEARKIAHRETALFYDKLDVPFRKTFTKPFSLARWKYGTVFEVREASEDDLLEIVQLGSKGASFLKTALGTTKAT
jgi:hypothetical protein